MWLQRSLQLASGFSMSFSCFRAQSPIGDERTYPGHRENDVHGPKQRRTWTSRWNKRAKAAYILPPPRREIVAPGIVSAFPYAALAKSKLMLRIHERG